jgi:hypothetical protein
MQKKLAVTPAIIDEKVTLAGSSTFAGTGTVNSKVVLVFAAGTSFENNACCPFKNGPLKSTSIDTTLSQEVGSGLTVTIIFIPWIGASVGSTVVVIVGIAI